MLKGLRHTSKGFLMAYCCCLMAMSMLFVGVSFARFTSMTSAVGSGNIAPFVYQYFINDVSSLTFNNSDFKLPQDGGYTQVGSKRSIRFVVRNYNNENTVEQISGVDLQPTITMNVPAEFMDNVAFQFAADINSSNTEAIMPQFVFGHFLYNVTSDTAEPGNIYKYTYGTPKTGTYEINTADFPDYEARPYADATYQVVNNLTLANLKPDGSMPDRPIYEGDVTISEKITAADGITITYEPRIKITAKEENVKYSVGFERRTKPQSEGESSMPASEVFIHLQRPEQYYTIDFTFPGMIVEGGKETTRAILFEYTITQMMDHMFGNLTDSSQGGTTIAWNDLWSLMYWQGPTQCGTHTDSCGHKLNDAEIIGYSFNQEVPVGQLAGSTFTRGKFENNIFVEDNTATAIVRFNKYYDYVTGTVTSSLDHVPANGDKIDEYRGTHIIKAYQYKDPETGAVSPYNPGGSATGFNGNFVVEYPQGQPVFDTIKNLYAKCDTNNAPDLWMQLTSLYENPLGKYENPNGGVGLTPPFEVAGEGATNTVTISGVTYDLTKPNANNGATYVLQNLRTKTFAANFRMSFTQAGEGR